MSIGSKFAALLLLVPTLAFADGISGGNNDGISRLIKAGGGSGIVQPASSVLLHLDGANGSTTFTDSSGNGHIFTAHGNVALSTAQSKFGTASLYNDGSTWSNSIQNTDSSLNFGAGDFTIDFWMRWQGAQGRTDFYFWDGTAQVQVYTMGPGNVLDIYGGGSGLSIAGVTAVTADTWHHIAMTRQGGTFRIFLDGNVEATQANSYNFSSATIIVTSYNNALKGWLDEFRIVVGTAVWTANFTPPTVPYTH